MEIRSGSSGSCNSSTRRGALANFAPAGKSGYAHLWRKVNIPVLLIYGEKDELATADQNITAIGDAVYGRVPLLQSLHRERNTI